MHEEEIDQDWALKPYIIPANVKTRFEIFEGFGFRELIYLLLAAIMGLCLGLIVWFISGQIFWLGLAVPGGALGFLFGKPNPRTGRNTFHIIQDIRNFNRRPKRYYYRFGDGRGK